MPNSSAPVWEHARTAPESIAVLGEGFRWTYRTLREHVAAFAQHLRDSGVQPGDRILLVAPSVPEFVAAYYAIHAAGAVAVTANTMATSTELKYIGADSRHHTRSGLGDDHTRALGCGRRTRRAVLAAQPESDRPHEQRRP